MQNTNARILLIGDPVGHSLSPLLQNALAKRLGLNLSYSTLRIPKDELKSWLVVAKDAVRGFNVTMPHKTMIAPFLDTLSEDARLFESVNTVVVKDRCLHGYNTDGEGFIKALRHLKHSINGVRFTILGAGGVARAISLKLASHGAESITLCCRTSEHGDAIKKCADQIGVSKKIHVIGFMEDNLKTAFKETDYLINATPLGMHGFPYDLLLDHTLRWLKSDALVYDTIYKPNETPLIKSANKLGHQTFNGICLLVHQGILSMEMFADIKIDAEEHAPYLYNLLAGC